MFPTPTLSTGRLDLRPYLPADAAFFRSTFTDFEVSRYMGDGRALSVEEADSLFVRVHDVIYAEGRWPIWAVTSGGAIVGHAEVKPSPGARVDGWEIVYALLPAAWGSGLGTELAGALTSYAHDELGHEIVHATVDPDNAASVVVLHRLGYQDEPDILDEDGAVTRHLCHRAGDRLPAR